MNYHNTDNNNTDNTDNNTDNTDNNTDNNIDNIDTLFKINKISILSTWCYDLENNSDCTICRNNLNCNSIYAEDKNEESFIVTGACGHSFHNDCINNWIKPVNIFVNNHCPICSNKWIAVSNTKNEIIIGKK